ncbi:(d)CMP kinase [Vitreoscilla massiliensis]|uniref:Cytidylate kinase n=1 Tax=Vitreoscilla massiliensis TaxID=1689272 RepID=A0ABY4E1N3_9NEIS|nr:(d)CMP kinase [Vitreoscilla massiliensis]UOO88233.1 (d)CMP kinase [Vitreoscilla massiliensis]
MTAVIAIDGPSASGKGTVAARVAAALDMDYLDSGALYRLTALAAQQQSVAWDDEAAVAAIAAQLPVEFVAGQILLQGEDVSVRIRQEEIGMGASQVAKWPAVRAALLQRQRDFARNKGLVADGRDMGSVVFPDAKLKVFLTATAEERARRRALQLHIDLDSEAYAAIVADIKQRDLNDTQRAVAPLKQLPDAHLLDTTELSIENAVKKVLDWYRQS